METTPTLAKIYRPAKTAMQSGRAKTHQWLLEFERPAPGRPDALMGWNSMPDTQPQVRLWFPSEEEAVAYATAKNIPFVVKKPQVATLQPKAYAENFSFNRRTSFDPKVNS